MFTLTLVWGFKDHNDREIMLDFLVVVKWDQNNLFIDTFWKRNETEIGARTIAISIGK